MSAMHPISLKAVQEMAVELKSEGLSPTEIGRRLGVSDSMARKYLKMAVEA